MDFKLNGKPIKPAFVLDIKKILKFIDNLPFGELIDTKTLLSKFNLTNASFMRDKIKEFSKDNFVYGPKNAILYGSKKTIKEYKKQASG